MPVQYLISVRSTDMYHTDTYVRIHGYMDTWIAGYMDTHMIHTYNIHTYIHSHMYPYVLVSVAGIWRLALIFHNPLLSHSLT